MFPEGRILDFVIVGVVALIVVGPKDLPVLMRKVGQFVARMRALAAEFRASFDEIARQSELDELRREVEAMRAGHPLQSAVLGREGEQVFGDIQIQMSSDQPSLPFDESQPHTSPEASPETVGGAEASAQPVKAAP